MKKLPNYIQGLVILCWGWQVEMLIYAIPMAILLELKIHVNRRWVFSKKEFYLLADVTSVVLVALIIYYFSTSRAAHFIFYLLQVMPLVFYPLVLALNFSTTDKLGMDVFFYSVRNDKMSDPGQLELDHIYIGVCLTSMATQVESRSWFLALAAVFMLWIIYTNRSVRYKPLVWIGLVVLVAVASTTAEVVLRDSHLLLKKKTAEWLAGLIRSRTDPFKTKTALGRVGELKLSDQILFRVAAAEPPGQKILLQEASYDTSSDDEWLLLNPRFKQVEHAQQDNWRWYRKEPNERALTFYLDYNDDKALIPVPQNAVALEGFNAVEIDKSAYGTLQAVGITPQSEYLVRYLDGAEINGLPDNRSDLYLTDEHVKLVRQVINVDASLSMKPEERVQYVKQFFENYRYTLYQPAAEFATSPMENFLKVTHAGHCEYFASATAMMLRVMNVPARYVVGYSVQEYSPTLGMYIVRSRHAHAWVIAYYQDQWHVVDNTPSIWLEAEEGNSAYYQPGLDLMANMLFMARNWWTHQTEDAKTIGLMILAFLLFVFLSWRMMGSPQIHFGSDEQAEAIGNGYQGFESPFYRIQALLEQQGMWRNRGESLTRWIARIKRDELLEFLPVHYKWRFDPSGASDDEKQWLIHAVDVWVGREGSA